MFNSYTDDKWAGLTGLDQLAAESVAHLSSPFFDHCFLAITKLGSFWAVTFLAVGFTILLVVRGKWRDVLFMDGCVITAWWIMIRLKELLARPRPLGEHLTYATGFSFPSGHAMVSTALYGFLAYLALQYIPGRSGKIIAYILIILVFLIGISRVYLNVHYFSDVVAGFLLGAIILLVFVRLLKAYNKSRF
jgi:undecaprenyl-diphosphatase